MTMTTRREMTGSVSSECDLDADVDGIELEAIPESPKSSRPDPDWDRESLNEIEVLIYLIVFNISMSITLI